MRCRLRQGRPHTRVRPVIVAAFTAAMLGLVAPGGLAQQTADNHYTLQLQALTGGPAGTRISLHVVAAPGLGVPQALTNVHVQAYGAAGRPTRTWNWAAVSAPDGMAANLQIGAVPRHRRLVAEATVTAGTPAQTHVLSAATRTLLRPDLAVDEIAPEQTLVGQPTAIGAVISEQNGDVGATATVSLSAVPGATEAVSVPPGGRVTVRFRPLTFASAVPIETTATVAGVVPSETSTANNIKTATVEVTGHQLPSPHRVLFPSLVGYGAQFGMHLYAPITPWPTAARNGDVEEKVKLLEPQLVRIFYNDNWDGNANGKFPDWRQNYESFVKVVQLAQDAGATIDVSFQNLGNAMLDPQPAMAKFADVLEELVRTDRITNLRWVEVGNEPNAPTGAVTLAQYSKIARALHDELMSRGLHDRIKLMGPGLLESGGARHHYVWTKWMAANMKDVFDAYSQHIYWWYDQPGRLEYRLRDVSALMQATFAPGDRKPLYIMEFGVRGYGDAPGKPTVPNLYYLGDPPSEIWRTNIAAFQQLWFNIDAGQLGVAGTAKWDAFWSMYDKSSVTNQLYWMVGPPSEGSPLTPTYNAMSLLFHVTAPGWDVIGLEPWEQEDWSVATYGSTGLSQSSDQAEQELVGYAGPNGELSIVGLDTHGRALNAASTDPPSHYSIGGLPPDTTFRLAVWNATGDGTSAVVGRVTTNAAGVARFDVPLQAGFALTTVPVA
jgi:hypothetical protein